MESLTELYHDHLATLQQRTRQVLDRFKLDTLLIHSGELLTVFLDDHTYPFKANPQFKAWLPISKVANCWLLTDGVNKPRLWFYLPDDYWNCVEPLPDAFWTSEFELMPLKNADDIGRLLPADRHNVAYIGPATGRARQLQIAEKHINPDGVINYFHYYRAYKTEYELFCMREAQKIAVTGHRAAHQAFMAGKSEFDINLVYLAATGQRDEEVPYSNIVALNEHACVLHYTMQDCQPPVEIRSFLLDAGSEYNGYAADLTRTWAMPDVRGGADYAELIRQVSEQQQALIATMRTGVCYSEYHFQFHQRLAGILLQQEIITGISEEAAVQADITGSFMPHGIGHLLGIQVHDVAGFMQDDGGTHLPAPEKYPWLRCTRILAPGMVLTIEPGIYFIESLLARWRTGALSRHFNWKKIEALQPFGGVRIEDNVVIHSNTVENMTRDLQLV